ncbi:MAG TPA: hypothetical protein VFS27_04520 [Blastocatellia bacterium]|nr:hypothetical protein [Blastocatellia bacterium]
MTGPVGGLVRGLGTAPHPILMTARIPLTAFGNAPLTNLRGGRFTFDDTRDDDIHIGNIRLSRGQRNRQFHADLYNLTCQRHSARSGRLGKERKEHHHIGESDALFPDASKPKPNPVYCPTWMILPMRSGSSS